MNHSLGKAVAAVNHGWRLSVDKLSAGLLNALAAPRCQFCGQACGDLALCPACHRDLPWNRIACPRCARPQSHAAPCARCSRRPPPWSAAWSAFRLEAPVREAIHQLKYRAGLRQARVFGRLLGETLLASVPDRPPLLLPVPLHRHRLMRRGYNQAQELAREVAAVTGQRLVPDQAQRLRATPDQIGLSAAQRRRNLRGAFRASASLDGQRVALLDDVMTTGATLGALAQACREAGAVEVQAWSLARVP